MDGSINVFGYSARVALRGAFLRRCIVRAVLWSIVCAVMLLGALLLDSPAALTLAAVLCVIVVVTTLPTFRVEYDYEIEDGVFTAAKITGASRRRLVVSVDLRKVTLLSEITDDKLSLIEREEPAVSNSVLSAADGFTPSLMLYTDQKNRLCVLYFDANERFFKAARFYCPAAMRR